MFLAIHPLAIISLQNFFRFIESSSDVNQPDGSKGLKVQRFSKSEYIDKFFLFY